MIGSQLPSHFHLLRSRQKEVISDMICKAVPLTEDGVATSPTLAHDSTSNYHNQVSNNYATAHSSVNIGGSIINGSKDNSNKNTHGPPTTWRLLIFDDWGRDIIAPLLNVNELRQLGVTLYMHIKTERDSVAGAPAIYLCAPTMENVNYIINDCALALYEWVYINFTSQAPRELLEHFACQLASRGLPSIHHIRVVDWTLNYIALENDLFSLMLPRSFTLLNQRGALHDTEVESHIHAMVTGLAHVILSQQVIPIIAHVKTGAAEEVARRLAIVIRDAIHDKLLEPPRISIYGRPVLLIGDRSSDLASALHHPFTYRGLLIELGHMKLNKCTVEITGTNSLNENLFNSLSSSSAISQEIIELDPDRDAFYSENASLDFSAIGTNIEQALKAYKAEYTALSKNAGDGVDDNMNSNLYNEGIMNSNTNINAEDDDLNGTNAMSRLLASAPRLSERKKYLDAHTKLAYNFLRVIRARLLDRFHGVEQGIIQHSGLDKEEFARLLNCDEVNANGPLSSASSLEKKDSEGKGTVQDQQRLCLIAYLVCIHYPEEFQLNNAANANYNTDEERFVQEQLDRYVAKCDHDIEQFYTVNQNTSEETYNKNSSSVKSENKRHFAALKYLQELRQFAINNAKQQLQQQKRGEGNDMSKTTSTTTSSSPASPASLLWQRGLGSNNNNNNNEGFAWGLAQQIARTITSSLNNLTDTELPLTKLVSALLTDRVATSSGMNTTNNADDSNNSNMNYTAGLTSALAGAAPSATTAGSLSGQNANVSQMRSRLLNSLSALDPRTNKLVNLHETHFTYAIVFVIGGGCVNEYDNLKSWEVAHPRKSVLYGCTELISGEDMLRELTVLGNEQV